MSNSLSQETLLLLAKDGEKYLFKYVPGNEKNVFFAMLEIGRNEEFNISLVEVFGIIRKISEYLQSKGRGRNIKIEWPLDREDALKELTVLRKGD